MEAYENGAHAYHTTMPTDALTRAARHDAGNRAFGFDKARARSRRWARRCARCSQQGLPERGGPGFEAPGVVVSYTDDPEIESPRNSRPGPADRRRRAAAMRRGRPTSAPSASACSASTSWNVERTVQKLERALAGDCRACAGGVRAGRRKRYTISRSTSTTSAPAAVFTRTRNPGGPRSASRSTGSGVCDHGRPLISTMTSPALRLASAAGPAAGDNVDDLVTVRRTLEPDPTAIGDVGRAEVEIALEVDAHRSANRR